MKNEVVPKQTIALTQVSEEVIMDYLQSLGNNLPEHHIKKFIHIAKAFNLNPFLREIYGIPYGNNFNIIVGYEVPIKRAERSGKLAGWRAWTEGSPQNGDLKGCIEIKRKDWEEPFYHEVYFDEYNQNNSMWKSKPRTMIKKVAIAQGFRLAFPDELAGMPYTADEIEVEPVETPIIEHTNDTTTQERDIKKEFATYIANQGVPKQAFKQFAEFAMSKMDIDFKNDEVKIKLLEDKETLNGLIQSFLQYVSEAEEAL
ncbi:MULTISPECIES: phage recombination protein Bet [unclassified Nitratiruptor]|uniref:phage recombination protein Bet n=1 Tax=unclassified Nitratiruptor TaxID=2624044 RepID=UPI001915A954|nr:MULTISPECIES: phage recombination protein Bet [unclassified Nitratiruptor]BCD59599.1 phage recombination protein Beta [Nitratiruptor sp. YY08-10]BCD63523.1 phage recombination protein Beta [Nitratiruptor sp. YY08-14]BCD83075.1 phage recombination protein Beta [Nitratiruptor phage NrS-2]BCD83141.1 phage recombination protein Beta [Nitratiruptor phage NrS-3]